QAAAGLIRAPRRVLMPLILAFCIVGAYASNNSVYGIVIMLVFGVLGFIMEENDIPIAPCILGIVLGPIVDARFVSGMIRGDGSLLYFFERPIAAALGLFVLGIWGLSLYGWLRRPRLASLPSEKTADSAMR